MPSSPITYNARPATMSDRPHQDPRGCKRPDLVALHPDQEQRDEGHKETMTIIFIIDPHADHDCESVVVNHSQQRGAETQRPTSFCATNRT